MLASGALTKEEEHKLLLILDIKEFGEREIGLAPGDNYTTYYDVRDSHISWLVSACAQDGFRPYIWSFPIVGDLPYAGFFAKADALAEARELKRQGWDVSVRPVAAYSTLGWFSDPVLSTMLRYREEELADLILHELTHGTVFVEGRADLNERLASFVGTTAALQYLRMRFGASSEPYRRAVAAFADRETFSRFLDVLHARLDALYTGEGPREGKLRGREAMYESARREYLTLPLNTRRYDQFLTTELNNAELLAERRYAGDEPFRSMYDDAGAGWTDFWRRVRAWAASQSRS